MNTDKNKQLVNNIKPEKSFLATGKTPWPAFLAGLNALFDFGFINRFSINQFYFLFGSAEELRMKSDKTMVASSVGGA